MNGPSTNRDTGWDGRPHVAVIGGGLAGLSAAWALAEASLSVKLFEARQTLGGRLRSINESAVGMVIDTCQHLALGCCREFLDFAQRVGFRHCLARHRELYFASEGHIHRFRPLAALPAPLHLLSALWQLRFLTIRERLGLVRAAWKLSRMPIPSGDHQMVDGFLRATQQSQRVVQSFWGPLFVSAAAETLDRIPVGLARQIVREVFFASRGGYELWIPTVPLTELCDRVIRGQLESRGVRIVTGCPVRAVLRQDTSWVVGLGDGCTEPFAAVILAVPWWTAARLLPREIAQAVFRNWPEVLDHRRRSPEACAITGIHLWFDRAGFAAPHAVVPEELAQWVFRPAFCANEAGGESSAGCKPWYCQVVVSASHRLLPKVPEECLAEVQAELRRYFPRLKGARLVHHRIITEPAAVLSPHPDWDRKRPGQKTPFSGLALAGDWTTTGWPGTMESAVRSGRRAAEVVLQHLGRRRAFQSEPQSAGM